MNPDPIVTSVVCSYELLLVSCRYGMQSFQFNPLDIAQELFEHPRLIGF